ncbi:pseudouridine synthase [Aliikangiella marina]|uniref:Pseudouridine synthase n=1 Tax=Aliikangiella marina TaxID=1712262 RepID=A0A545TI69_9GAMM|nr:pseudouridine synthase [Aliikangiella marina]TQV76929.1 pseudouridine synthase [Aliikangiella marina]
MRLDKYLCQATSLTRSQAKKIIVSSRVKIGTKEATSVVVNPAFKVSETHQVLLDGEVISALGNRYIVLNKPAGYICSTIDELYPSALRLVSAAGKSNLHFAGRLDQDTTGLVLISDDGDWTHRVTSPKSLCAKTYRVWLAEALSAQAQDSLEQGVLLKNESKITRPAHIQVVTPQQVLLTIREGKYHQVKRMFAAVGNKVEKLHRESIGEITLENLQESQWRELNPTEIVSFK